MADWGSITQATMWCYFSYLRGDSIQIEKLSDLVIDATHGPVHDGPNAQMLCRALRKGLHKEELKKDKMVSVWRNKFPFAYTTGMTAMVTIYPLN